MNSRDGLPNDGFAPGDAQDGSVGLVWTQLDLSDFALSDSGGLISSITASNVSTTTSGNSSNTTLSVTALLTRAETPADGTHLWRVERTNWPVPTTSGDKGGVLVGLDDDASLARSVVGGIYASATVRSVNYAEQTALTAVTENDLARVEVEIKVGTDPSGGRTIGPGSITAYDSAGAVLLQRAIGDGHAVSGNLREVVHVRRGTTGAPAADMDVEVWKAFIPAE